MDGAVDADVAHGRHPQSYSYIRHTKSLMLHTNAYERGITTTHDIWAGPQTNHPPTPTHRTTQPLYVNPNIIFGCMRSLSYIYIYV